MDATDRLRVQIEAHTGMFEYNIGKAQKALEEFESKRSAINQALHQSLIKRGGFASPFERLNLGTKQAMTNFDKITAKAAMATKVPDMAIASISEALDRTLPKFTDINEEIKKFGNLSRKGMTNFDNVIKKTIRSMDAQIKEINKASKATARFDMRLLSLLFGGMALKRLFGGMLRSITNTFLKAEDNTSGLSQATTRLHAAWEFLKFSIFDALDTDLFIKFLDWIVGVINWFSQLDRKWKIAFLAISAGLVALGTFMMAFAQIKLLWDAIFGIGGFLAGSSKIIGVEAAATGAGGSGLLGILSLIRLLSAMAAIILSVHFAKGALSATSFWESLWKSLTSAGLLGLAGFNIIKWAGTLIGGEAGAAATAAAGPIAFAITAGVAIYLIGEWLWGKWEKSPEELLKQQEQIAGGTISGQIPGMPSQEWTAPTDWLNTMQESKDGIYIMVEEISHQFEKVYIPKTDLVTTAYDTMGIEVDNLTNTVMPNHVTKINNEVIPALDSERDAANETADGFRNLAAAIRDLNAARSEASSSGSEEEDITITSSVK